jgi:SanA protein
MRKKLNHRKLIIISLILGLVLITTIFISNYLIDTKGKRFIYNSIEKVPANKAGLLLGTSKYIKKGIPNPYFYYRIDAAVKLYRQGKIKNIILSGDNRLMSYNEPMMMKRELLKLGIPDSAIYLDYAGFRTFDSVIRSREIFEQSSITIISQRFHLERAIYIAHHYGIGAIGYEAQNVNFKFGIRTSLREYFARVLVFWDFHSGNQPKFLGEKVIIK